MKEMLDALSSGETHFTAAAVTQGITQDDVKPIRTRDNSSNPRATVGWLLLVVAADVSAVAADHNTMPTRRTLQGSK